MNRNAGFLSISASENCGTLLLDFLIFQRNAKKNNANVIPEYSTLNPFDNNELEFNEISQNNIDNSEIINYGENQNSIFDTYEVKKEIISSEEKLDNFI